jgi:prepilin-type N-terminal cleavage/methylation domain-containing protein
MGQRMKERGVSLGELLVVLAVIAVLVAAGAPMFIEWLRGYRVRTTAHQVQAELRLARNVAVSRSASASVLVRSAEVRWTDGQDRERDYLFPEGVSITNLLDPVNGDAVTFLRNGQPSDPAKTLIVEGWVGGNRHHRYTITFTPAGEIESSRTITEVVMTGGGGGGGGGGEGGGRRR